MSPKLDAIDRAYLKARRETNELLLKAKREGRLVDLLDQMDREAMADPRVPAILPVRRRSRKPAPPRRKAR